MNLKGVIPMAFKLPDMGALKDLLGGQMKNLSLDKLLSSDFVAKYTKASSVQDLLAKLGLSGQNSIEEISQKTDIDEKVNENTRFSNWKEMLEKAVSEYNK